jgi:RimJ/RimL family protein N-acetyltransferase
MYWITGKHAAVRPMEESDAALIVAWRNRPDAARWLVQWQPLTVDGHLSWFRQACDRELLLVFEDPSGTPIGGGNFYGLDPKALTAEWGRIVSAGVPSAMLEACYLAHRVAFELLGFERTFCGLAEPNGPARKLTEFLGYRQEGFRRSHLVTPHGTYNVLEYGLLAPEFQERGGELARLFYRGRAVPEFTAEAREFAPECRRRWRRA